jgi:hypothetical protein
MTFFFLRQSLTEKRRKNVRFDYVHSSSYLPHSQSVVIKRPSIVDILSFSSIKMATMEFDEVYEEIRGVLVSSLDLRLPLVCFFLYL